MTVLTKGLAELAEADLPLFVEAIKIANNLTAHYPDRTITIEMTDFEIRLHSANEDYYVVIARAYMAPPGGKTQSVWIGGK